MTVAVDRITGRVVGQVVEVLGPPQKWVTTIKIFSKDGYSFVSDLSVRLEKV